MRQSCMRETKTRTRIRAPKQEEEEGRRCAEGANASRGAWLVRESRAAGAASWSLPCLRPSQAAVAC